MGIYNPHVPSILGQEWAPVRFEPRQIQYGREIGYGFNNTTAVSRVTEGKFYIANSPPAPPFSQEPMLHLYRRGEEDQSGPVQVVDIPVSGSSTSGTVTLNGGATVAACLSNPSDNNYITIADSSRVDLNFAVSSYGNLANKRILNVELLYTAAGANGLFLDAYSGVYFMSIMQGANEVAYATELSGPENLPDVTTVKSVQVGDTNPFWASPPFAVANVRDSYPWRYSDLQRLAVGASNPLTVRVAVLLADDAPILTLGYLAMRVTYCEEKRVAYGARQVGYRPSSITAPGYPAGPTTVVMRTPTMASGFTLDAGEYVLAVSLQGPINIGSPEVNALREIYAVDPQPGIDVRQTTVLGETFQSIQSHVIPHLSLHTSGGVIPSIHPYGTQVVAPVYGTVTASQGIQGGSAIGGNYSYEQVRFYARRFGDTTQPLLLSSTTFAASGSAMQVQITPQEWDALPEILDGWKEVTLTFPTAPTMGVLVAPTWTWSATGETAGNRWEVLGASSAYQFTSSNLGAATYGGTNRVATWAVPPSTGMVTDNDSDMTLIFSSNLTPISGFGVDEAFQELTTVDPDCPDFTAGCTITQLAYNELTWTALAGSVRDDFDNRTVSGGWGSASDTGGAWTVSVTASDFSVSNGTGNMLISSTTSRRAVIGSNAPDVDVMATVTVPVLATGDDIGADLVARWTDSDNTYLGRVLFKTTGAVTAQIDKRVASVQSTIGAAVTLPFVYQAGSNVRLRFQVNATTLQFKAWLEGTPEPPAWNVFITDTSLTTGLTGMRGIVGASNTNIPLTLAWDDFLSQPFAFGSYEIDRYDTVDGEFSTIARITDPTKQVFNDYEARVGFDSVYRIRVVDVYDFAGLWSSQITGGITAPGVVGADSALLLLTTNSVQDGSSNLAYSAAWEGRVVEDYQWPEANDVVLQNMYNKDFPTAFRPLERGGERFTRNVLVNAAGVPPVATARGFKSLRDLAWETVPYVCVRDETGERWYSTLIVPSGNMRRMITMGRLCLAQVQVIEVTDTPFPVDPE